MTNCCTDARCSSCRSGRKLVLIAVVAMIAGTYDAEADRVGIAPAVSPPPIIAPTAQLILKPDRAPSPQVAAPVTVRIAPLELDRLDAKSFGD